MVPRDPNKVRECLSCGDCGSQSIAERVSSVDVDCNSITCIYAIDADISDSSSDWLAFRSWLHR